MNLDCSSETATREDFLLSVNPQSQSSICRPEKSDRQVGATEMSCADVSDRDKSALTAVERVKAFLTRSSITKQNLAAVSHTVCAHVGGPKMLGDAAAPAPPSDGRG